MINDLVKLIFENNHFYKDNIKPGNFVLIVLKEHQKTELLTYGQVKNLLTSKPIHTRGIKVRLTTGQVGRVQRLLPSSIKKITFPKTEHKSLISDLSEGYDILTTRILNEKNKYNTNDILESDLGYFLEVIKVETYKNISDHPYLKYLDSFQLNQIGNNPFDIVYLRKVGKINK